MKRILIVLLVLLGWFALIAQYVIMLENRVASFTETTIRFISFFTILTNFLVAVYFTYLLLPANKRPQIITNPSTLTAITIYILIVCLVYQVALRSVWEPKGLQRVVDELLHTIVPILVLFYWYLYASKKSLRYKQIAVWAIYPLVYLIYTLIRGNISKFYPYPFIDVTKLGLEKTLLNAVFILILFLVISLTFIFIGRSVIKK